MQTGGVAGTWKNSSIGIVWGDMSTVHAVVGGAYMKRICIYCDNFESGGIEAYLCNILTHMDLSGLEVDIVAARISQSVFASKIRAKRINLCPLSGKTSGLLKNHMEFKALLREKKYSAVYCNIFHALSMWYLWTAKQAGVPIRIAHSHNSDLRPSITRQLKLVIHRLARRVFTSAATQMWACSMPAMEFMFPQRAIQARMIQLIPNGIETQNFSFDAKVRDKVRTELHLQKNFVIGNIGRLCTQKNQSFLLDVFQKIYQRIPSSRLLLIGDGEKSLRLQEKAARLGVEGAVLFMGLREDIPKLLWAMDFFVLPSIFEGLPITAVEAQAAGLPCIFSDRITQEAVVMPNAVCMPLEDGIDAWADAILRLKEKGYDRKSAAIEMRERGFDIGNTAKYVEKILRG